MTIPLQPKQPVFITMMWPGWDWTCGQYKSIEVIVFPPLVHSSKWFDTRWNPMSHCATHYVVTHIISNWRRTQKHQKLWLKYWWVSQHCVAMSWWSTSVGWMPCLTPRCIQSQWHLTAWMAKRNKGVEAEATTDAVTLVELWATPSAHVQRNIRSWQWEKKWKQLKTTEQSGTSNSITKGVEVTVEAISQTALEEKLKQNNWVLV
jgi:hypothetical protein